MTQPLALVAGLGNPGVRYDPTRHNAGFWFVDEVVRRHGGSFRLDTRFNGEVAQVEVGGTRLTLLKPATFMNRSGQSVATLARYFKLDVEQILIVHDEIDLPAGAARLKTGGGPGGHNGLKDIIAQLGNNRGFHRLRLGVGHPGERDQVIDYVLHRPRAEEQRQIEEAMADAMDVFELVAGGDMANAMQRLHTKG
jgi:PTH1 family peptidyl-tRNA hydrolase